MADGICKINVFTDLIKACLNASDPGCNPLKKGQPGFFQHRVVEDILHRYFELSGSLGVAIHHDMPINPKGKNHGIGN